MNKAGKGRRIEYKVRDILGQAGYYVVRAAKSGGLWDLVGIGPGKCRLIQVKTRDWPYGVEREQLEMFEAPEYCQKEVWRARKEKGRIVFDTKIIK